MKKIKSLLSLYRKDVFSVIFVVSLIGFYVSYKTITLSFILKSLFIAGILYNFVYTSNSISDIKEDTINNKNKPLVTGEISLKEASLYSFILILLSTILSPVFFSGWNLLAAYLVILMGTLYSFGKSPFKNRPFIAPIITGWGIVNPLFITGSSEIISIIPGALLFTIGTTLLKDLADKDGDTIAGRKTVAALFSAKDVTKITCILTTAATVIILLQKYWQVATIPLFIAITTGFYLIKHSEKYISKNVYRDSRYITMLSTIITLLLIIFFN